MSPIVLTMVLTACGSKSSGANAPGAQSPERQSEAEYDVARDYFYKGQRRAALDHIRRAIELDDENRRALYFASAIYLSFCSESRGLHAPDCKLKEAERYARLALEADENFRDAKNTLGAILILEGRHKEAIALLEPLTRDPAYEASHLAWGNLGWAQVLSGAVDAGIASLQNAITQPRFCVGHYRLGIAYEKKRDLEQAETSLTNAVTVDDPACQNLQEAWGARGRIRLKLGKPSEARADFEKCRDISAETETGKTCVQMLIASTNTPNAPASP